MIDHKRIDELKDDIGEDAFQEVIELFLDEVEQALLGLRSRTDDTPLAERMHFLKGCALNVGFSALAELTSEGERIARAKGPSAVALAPIYDAYARSKDALMHHLSDSDREADGTFG